MTSNSMTKTKKCGCHAVPAHGYSQGTVAETPGSDTNETALPPVDIIETDKDFFIIADMPGATEDSIDVQFNGGELTITGEMEKGNEEEEVVCRCRQFLPTRYYRTFRLGESINSDAIAADYDNGVLTIQLPKRAEIQPKKISVNKK